MNTVLRVNTRTGEIRALECSADERRWGGRAFIAQHFLAEVNPACDALGRQNRLIVASGLLADTGLTTAGRVSLGGKSPLTGGVKEANVGGAAGKRMARLGLKAVVLEDAPDDRQARILLISKEGARLLEAPELAGQETSATLAALRQRFGERMGALCVGPAGEMRLAAAVVADV